MWKKRIEIVNSLKDYFTKKHGNIEKFFEDTREYELPNAKEAAQLIQEFSDRCFYIIGDYDVDGIVGTAIMKIGLERRGYKVIFRIPKRFSEGYGICDSIIEEVPKDAVVITVDNGISAIEQIRALKARGHPVIVTDHHLPVTENDEVILPDADIIVNPKVKSDGFDGYCGAGVAYKIIKNLLPEVDVVMPLLTAYAAIGTVADMMDLVKENRFIVTEGLKVLNGERGILTRGMKALLQVLGKEKLTSTDIAYGIAPMLNAPGRLEDDGALMALSLIIQNKDIQESIQLALVVREKNEMRKKLEKEAIEKVIDELPEDISHPLIVYIPDVGEGVIGLIAANLVKEYRVPSFVFTDAKEEGIIKGSGRSVDGVHMKELLDKSEELYVTYGGHEGAAGIKMKKNNLEAMREKICFLLEDFSPDKDDYYDVEICPKQAEEVYRELEKFAPFGRGNEKPVIALRSINPTNYRVMGSEKQHLRISCDGCDVLCFNEAKNILECQNQAVTIPMHFYGNLSVNEFRGVKTMQMIVNGYETEN